MSVTFFGEETEAEVGVALLHGAAKDAGTIHAAGRPVDGRTASLSLIHI